MKTKINEGANDVSIVFVGVKTNLVILKENGDNETLSVTGHGIENKDDVLKCLLVELLDLDAHQDIMKRKLARALSSLKQLSQIIQAVGSKHETVNKSVCH